MKEFEIHLFSPTGRVAEIYAVHTNCIACAVTQARIVIEAHPEFTGGEVRDNCGKMSRELIGSGPLH